MEHPVVYAFIFARGGSKGLPRKNIRPLAGKPLIAYSIEIAKQIPQVQRIIVSTDDAEIAAVAKDWGAEVPFMRPKELASDTCSERLAWQHALCEVGNTPTGQGNVLTTEHHIRHLWMRQKELHFQLECKNCIF